MQHNYAALPPVPSLGLKTNLCPPGLDACASMNAILPFSRWKAALSLPPFSAALSRRPKHEENQRKASARCPRTPSSLCRRPASRHQWSPRPPTQSACQLLRYLVHRIQPTFSWSSTVAKTWAASIAVPSARPPWLMFRFSNKLTIAVSPLSICLAHT